MLRLYKNFYELFFFTYKKNISEHTHNVYINTRVLQRCISFYSSMSELQEHRKTVLEVGDKTVIFDTDQPIYISSLVDGETFQKVSDISVKADESREYALLTADSAKQLGGFLFFLACVFPCVFFTYVYFEHIA